MLCSSSNDILPGVSEIRLYRYSDPFQEKSNMTQEHLDGRTMPPVTCKASFQKSMACWAFRRISSTWLTHSDVMKMPLSSSRTFILSFHHVNQMTRYDSPERA